MLCVECGRQHRCRLCGGDELQPVGDAWEVIAEKAVRSQNYYRAKTFSYSGAVDAWTRTLEVEVERLPIWAAEGKRRVLFVRLMGRSARPFDQFNLIGGLKPVVDAMVRLDVLVDDTPRYFEGYAWQERNQYQWHGLKIRIEDLLPS